MLKELWLEGFKAFKEFQEIELAPLTLIFGANSSGKSSIIQSLLMLKQSALANKGEDFLVLRGDAVDLGSFRNVIHGHNEDNNLAVHLSFVDLLVGWTGDTKIPSAGISFGKNPHTGSIDQYAIELGTRFGPIVFTPTSASAEFLSRARSRWYEKRDSTDADSDFPFDGPDEDLYCAGIRDLVEQSNGQTGLFPSRYQFIIDGYVGADLPYVPLFDIPGELVAVTSMRRLLGEPTLPLEIFSEDGRIWNLTEPTNQRGRRQIYEDSPIENDLKQISNLRRELVNATHLGPIRSMPPRVQALGSGWNRNASAQGENVLPLLTKKPEILRQLNHWLQRLEIPYSVSIEEISGSDTLAPIGDIQCLMLTDLRTGYTSSTLDVGFGISQVIPVVIHSLMKTPGSSLTLIEQPEIHLHPAVQARLMDLFIEQSQPRHRGGMANNLGVIDERGNRQFILETHSEHMILRLQKAIRLGRISPNRVSVLYVERGQDGHSHVKRLRLNDSGEFIDEWPGGFFDERLEEIFGD